MTHVGKMYDDRIRLRFSYLKNGIASGLLCRLCMNSHHRRGQLKDVIELILAAKPSVPLELDELLIRNGSDSPFDFTDEMLPSNPIFSGCAECHVDTFGRASLKTDVSKIADDLSLLSVSDPVVTSSIAVSTNKQDAMLLKDMQLACRRGPFLDGTRNENKALGAMHLKKILSELREQHSYRYNEYEYTKKINAVCNSRNWLTSNCAVCHDVNPNESYLNHILSEDHLNNMTSQGLCLTMAECHVLSNILTRTKRCLMSRDDGTLIGIRAPFLTGQPHPPNNHKGIVTDDVLKARIQLFRDALKLISQNCIYTGVSVSVSFNHIRRCPHCEVDLNRAKYLPHVLSEEHIAKVHSLGRYFYNEDIGLMACLIRFCTLLFEDDDDCKILKDDKENVKPPPFYLGYKPSDVADAMSLEEALDFAKTTEGEDFYLLYAADELKDMGYRVRDLHCEHCGKSTRSKGNSMVHITSAGHIREVMKDGMVFSRSNDRDLLLAVSNKAKMKLARRKKKLQASQRTEQASNGRRPPPRARQNMPPSQEAQSSKQVKPRFLNSPSSQTTYKDVKSSVFVEPNVNSAEKSESRPVSEHMTQPASKVKSRFLTKPQSRPQKVAKEVKPPLAEDAKSKKTTFKRNGPRPSKKPNPTSSVPISNGSSVSQ